MDDAELWELIDDYLDEMVIRDRMHEEAEPWDELMDDRIEAVCLGRRSRPRFRPRQG